MKKSLEMEINTLITERILTYHAQLIENGQIKPVELNGPSVIRPASHCNRLGHMQTDGQQEDPAPPRCGKAR